MLFKYSFSYWYILQKKRYCCVVSLTTFICFESDFNGFILDPHQGFVASCVMWFICILVTSPLVVLKAVSPIALHPPWLPHILGVTSWCMIPQYFKCHLRKILYHAIGFQNSFFFLTSISYAIWLVELLSSFTDFIYLLILLIFSIRM